MRSELKYFIPNDVVPILRAELAPYVYLDSHGRGFENVGYTVRSIYLDTHDLRYYREKKAGIKIRRKLRIRGYNTPTSTSWAFLEIKRKNEDKIHKNRAPVVHTDLEALFATGDVDTYIVKHAKYADAAEEARRFFYHVFRYNLRPTHMTVYEREAFLGRFDPTFRCTFDRNLRGGYYPKLSELYTYSNLREVRPGYTILEVKFDTQFPGWLRPMLATYDLRPRAISKYCHCAQVHKKQNDPKEAVMASASF